MARNKVLLVEDEAGIRGLIRTYLENRNYRVIAAENGNKAVKFVHSEKPQIILLDIEMPGMDGFEVCRHIRNQLDAPILFISGRQSLMDKLKCFELGGDDYITKPFDFAELEARIRANLRRYKQIGNVQSENHVLEYGDIKIDLDIYKCFVRGKEVPLSTKEMQLLILLAKRPNRVWSAEQLYDQIWGIDSASDFQTIKVHIRNLRKKLESDASNPRYIQTIRGFGYTFIE